MNADFTEKTKKIDILIIFRETIPSKAMLKLWILLLLQKISWKQKIPDNCVLAKEKTYSSPSFEASRLGFMANFFFCSTSSF